MSDTGKIFLQGRKRKRSDAGFITGQSGKKEAKRVTSEDVFSSAPDSVKIVDYVENRASEIIALTSQVDKIGGTKLVSQRLPRHMRRRALSHDIRRLPKRLREAAAKEIERASTTKRPSRKHRRRPKNLLSDYERRQRRIMWLETHIWHAKRFHMMEKWGYRLALHPNDKSMRACHRAADKYSLLQDVSYECCIELSGSEDDIKSSLCHVVSDKTGPTLLSNQFIRGNKWGTSMMFECEQYPKGAVGNISFLWRPRIENDKGRQLWIWCHPSCFQQVWDQLKQSILLEVCQGGTKSSAEDYVHQSTDKDPSSSESKTGATDDTESNKETCSSNGASVDCTSSVQHLFTAGGIKLRSLKDVMPKFRLTGQKSQAIVCDVLQPSDIENKSTNDTFWWQPYYRDTFKQKLSSDQRTVFDWLKTCQSPADVTPHCVISLTVRDPRLLLPPKRTKSGSEIEVSESVAFPSVGDLTYDSPLWEENVRQDVKTKRISNHELNKKRAENLVPGTPLNLGPEESRIPVLLLQRPGYRETVTRTPSRSSYKSIHQGFGCGWDVIVPPGWGLAFLVAFVFRGCRVGGMREAHAVARESGELFFPYDFPDTSAGRRHAEEQCDELQKKYGRNPPAKRPNYIKMGVTHPFLCPWSQLLKEWQLLSGRASATEEYFVLRDLKILKMLKEAFQLGQKASTSTESWLDTCPHKATLEMFVSENYGCLVPVRITMHAKGIPSQFASICIPTVEDLKSLEKGSDMTLPCEPKHPDPGLSQHRREKKANKKLKKSKKLKLETALANPSNPVEAALAQLITKDGGSSEGSSGISTGKGFAITKDGNTESVQTSLVTSACRRIIGFVNDGDFSLGQGQGHGKAFCSLLGFMELLRTIPANKPCLVLVRNTTSLQYRLAWLSVHL